MELFLKILVLLLFSIGLIIVYSKFLKKHLIIHKIYAVFLIFSLIPAFAFIYFAREFIESELVNFDNIIYTSVSSFIGPKLTLIMETISNLASIPGILAISILTFIILFWKKFNKVYSFMLVLNVIVAFVANTVLKNTFLRQRPDINRLIIESGFSFPSGHAMVSMAFFGYLAFLVLSLMEGKIRYFYTAIFGVLVLLIGISRIYLGVHYASDVIAGFFAGLAVLSISCALTDVLKEYIVKDIVKT